MASEKVRPENERLRIAAELRWAEPERTWDEIAKQCGVTVRQVYRWRQTEQWEIIHREIGARYVNDLATEAVAALKRAWKRGNPAGALDVLRALALLRNTEVNVNHRLGDEIDREIMELIEAAKSESAPR